MKIAKKVLSVLLAIALVLGTFAVAASANGNPDTASHQIKYWLTASPITAGCEWTTNAKYTNATWTDSQTGNMEVEPGQKVMIALHVTTNYYVGHVAGIVYMDSRLMDAGEIYTAQRGVAATKARTGKMTLWNTAHQFTKYCVLQNTIATPSSIAIDSGFLGDMNNCVSDDGNVPFKTGGGKFADAAEAKAAGWQYFKYDIFPDATNEETIILEDEVNSLIYFPVQIPDDAQPGDTYRFTMPEENIRRNGNKKGNMYLSECPDGVADATNLSNLANAYFNEDQYFDLTGTNITLTVKGGSTSEIDYSALQAKYDAVKDTVVANYDNTDAFVAALAAAKDMLDNQNAADQTAVDSALADLTAGYDALQIKSADYTALNNAKTAANAISADNYEQDANWTAFQTAKSSAEAIASGLDITHQAEIDAAATALTNAIANLTPKAVEDDANYTALDAEIATSQAIVDASESGWYTAGTWSAFTTALANAKSVDRTLKASSQSVIDNATSALATARGALVEADASYTALDALILESDALVEGDYTAASWRAFASALTAAKAVDRNLKAKDQATIDSAYNALNTAKTNLVALGGADYSELEAEIAKGTAYTKDYYTTETWSAYQTVLAAAQKMVDDNNLKETEQAQVSKMVEDLVAAKAALRFVEADYTAVNNAIAAIPATSDLSAYYTAESAAAVIAAKDAVVYGLTKDKQDEVDAYAAEIVAKTAALVLLPAETSALKTAIDKAAAINADLYTADSYNAMKAELDAANALYATEGLTKKNDQATVDAQTAALNNAVKNLVPAGADYSKVNAAIERFEALTESHWTVATWTVAKAKYDDAVTASQTVYTKEQQATLDAFADELNAAIDALVEADASYTALDSAIQKLNSNLTTYTKYLTEAYKTEAADLIAAANDIAFRALKAKDQATVDAKTVEVNALVDAPEFLPWDYTNINNAKAEYEAIDRTLYTEESLAVVDAIFANIKWDYVQDPVKRGDETISQYMAARNQEKAVLAWADSLELLPVVEYASYTALDEAIAAAEELLKETSIYTDESVKALQDAVAAGKALSRDLTIDEQATVDAAETAINNAMPLVEKDADYTALDAAIALAETKNAEDYTESSYNAMAAKLAAAKSVARNLKISDQGTVDTAANELNAAIAALQAKPAEVKGSVVSVDWTPSTSTLNTYVVRVNYVDGNYASKIQFVDVDGNTRTITRRSSAAVISTYNNDGSQCNELDREAAYDVWEITTSLRAGSDIKVIAKYDYTWESLDKAYVFTVNLVQPELDTTVHAITPDATEGSTGRIPVTVVTGMDIQGVRTVMANGATLTTKAYTVEDGMKVFNAQASCYLAGENVIKVQVKYGNEWHDAGEFTYTVK